MHIVIGITGPMHAGKTETAKHLRKERYFHCYSVYRRVYTTLELFRLPRDRDDVQKLGDVLSAGYGKRNILLHPIVEQIRERRKRREADGAYHLAVVEGLRRPRQVEFLRNKFPQAFIVAIDADIRIRFTRRRNTELDFDEFKERHNSPVQHQLAQTMALADAAVVNNGSLDFLRANLFEQLHEHGVLP